MTYDSYKLIIEKLESIGYWFFNSDKTPDDKAAWVVSKALNKPTSFPKVKSSLIKLGALDHEIFLAPAVSCPYPNCMLIYISLPAKHFSAY